MKTNYKKIKAGLSKLPIYDPNPNIWLSIEKQLDFEDKLSSLSKKISEYEPDEITWCNLEKKLKPVHRLHILKISSIAAAVTILIAVASWHLINQKNNGTITVSEELTNELKHVKYIDNRTDPAQAKEFIEGQCRIRSYVCQIPEFIEKKQRLDEITQKVIEIEGLIDQTGSTPSLLKTRAHLENLRSRLIKDLINIIKS